MKIIVAETFFDRVKGLLGKDSLPPNTGLLIKPCKQVHTFFMKFTIDVVFIDKKGIIVHLEKALKPFKISKYVWKAYAVIEFAEGTIEKQGYQIGQKISYL